jgi:enamine deaminase RidA (YjgF/YER057c/UK114 family)
MDISGFFTKFFDGTYLRRLLGIKLYGEISNITGFDRRTGQMAEGVQQFRVALQNLDFALRNRGLTKDAVVKVTIVSTDGQFALENWSLLDSIWFEYFGVHAGINPSNPLEATKPSWAFNSVPLIPGADLIPGAPCWMMLTATIETN